MRNHIQALALSRVLLGVALGLFSALSWAGPVTYYQELVSLAGTPTPGVSSPHSIPTSYVSDSVQVANAYETLQTVQISSTPIPAVFATTLAYNQYGEANAIAEGTLLYALGVSGPASTWVPVLFQGAYSMVGGDLAGDTPSFTGIDNTTVYFYVAGSGFSYRCYNYSCTSTTAVTVNSFVTLNDTAFGIDGLSGNFAGGVGIQTDATGNATAYVQMNAYSFSKSRGGIDDSIAGALIDPEFHIDAAWLALNPGATLSLPPGVGNAIAAGSSVPEPQSGLLMLTALGLLGALSRRRNRPWFNAGVAAAPKTNAMGFARPLLLAAVAVVASTTATAAAVTAMFQDYGTTTYNSGVQNILNQTYTYSGSSGSATASSATGTLPSISAAVSAAAATPNSYANLVLDVALSYEFEVQGPTHGTVVPVLISGAYQMQSLGAYYFFGGASVTTRTVDGAAADYSFSQQCLLLCSDSGTFGGLAYVFTDKPTSIAEIISLHAQSYYGFGAALGGIASASAFLDPYIQIDPNWALTNPGYSVSVSPGFGNAAPTASVPEPASYVLLLSGLGLMGFLGRRKQKNTFV